MSRKYYKIGEVSKILDVHIETLRRWDKSGQLKAIKIGKSGHRMYPVELINKVKSEGIHKKEGQNNMSSSLRADRLIDFHSSAVPDWQYFTRIVLAISTEVESYVDCKILDGPYDLGRDITGFYIKKYNNKKRLYIQCKRDKNISKAGLKKELDKIFKHSQEGKIETPDKIIFAISIDLNSTIQDSLIKHSKMIFPNLDGDVIFWCARELDNKLKSNSDLLNRFIKDPNTELNQKTYSTVSKVHKLLEKSLVIPEEFSKSNSKSKYGKRIKDVVGLMEQDDLEKALEYLIRLDAELNQNDGFFTEKAKVQNNMGLCYRNKENPNYDKAIISLRNAISFDPELWKAGCNLATTLALRNNSNDKELAWTEINKVWDKYGPMDILILSTYLFIYESKTNSKKTLKKALDLKKKYQDKKEMFNSATFRNFLSFHYLKNKNNNEAKKLVEENIVDDEFDVDAIYTKALIILFENQDLEVLTDDFLPKFIKPGPVKKAISLLENAYDIAKKQNRKNLLPEIYHNWDICRLWLLKNTGLEIKKLVLESTPKEYKQLAEVNKVQELMLHKKNEEAYSIIEPSNSELSFVGLISLSEKFFWNGSPEISLRFLDLAENNYPKQINSQYWLLKSIRQIILEDKFNAIKSCNKAKELAKDDEDQLQIVLQHKGAILSRYDKEGNRLLQNMLEFDEFFPDKKAIKKLNYNDEKDKKFIIKTVTDQRKWVDKITDEYHSKPLPSYTLEKPLNRTFIEIWAGRGINFYWEYTNPSLAFEEKLISILKTSKNLVFDYQSLLTLSKANLLGYLNRLGKKIYIHQFTYEKIQSELIQFENKHLRKLWNYIRQTQIISYDYAERELSERNQKISDVFDKWLIQSIQLAEEKKATFVTDDLRLLYMLRTEGLKTINSFSILKYLVNERMIESIDYSQALGEIADCLYSFIPFTADDLHEIVWMDNYELTKRSLHLIRQIFLPNANLDSFMSVFLSFIERLWKSGALPDKKVFWLDIITEQIGYYFDSMKDRKKIEFDQIKSFSRKFALMWGVAITNSNKEEILLLESKINKILENKSWDTMKSEVKKIITLKKTTFKE